MNGVRDVFAAMEESSKGAYDYFEPEDEEIRVDSSLKGEVDINQIVKRYAQTGLLPNKYNEAMANYGDMSGIPDFLTMKTRVAAAEAAFGELPAALRDRYGNDPALFLKNFATKECQDLLVEAGLATYAAAQETLGKASGEPVPESSTGSARSSAGKAGKAAKAAAESSDQE